MQREDNFRLPSLLDSMSKVFGNMKRANNICRLQIRACFVKSVKHQIRDFCVAVLSKMTKIQYNI